MTVDDVLVRLRSLADPATVRSMTRFAINSDHALGISVPELRRLAREIGKSHTLAFGLCKSSVFEARVLAAMIDEAARVSEKQMDNWVRAFDSWAICDACCGDLFDKTPFAWRKALEWSERAAEFEKRAGFSLMAALARHDPKAPDSQFKPFLAAIRRESGDSRNFVRKAVNWSLREIGKRNLKLNQAAIREAQTIRSLGTPSARWIAADAMRELRGEAVQARLRRRNSKLESRNSKVETRKARLEDQLQDCEPAAGGQQRHAFQIVRSDTLLKRFPIFEFPFSSFDFRVSNFDGHRVLPQ